LGEKQNTAVMDHIVTLDSRANEIENLIRGTKSMIIHGADVKCVPYGLVAEGDFLYFVTDSRSAEVKAKAIVSSVFNSYPLSAAESFEMIIRNQDKLTLPDDLFYKWAGKKYLVLIEVRDVEAVPPFSIDRDALSNADGWYPVGNIEDSVSRDCKTA
jgi:hypothetical protein